MAQTGYTPLLIYGSTTATNVPLAANLTTSASGVELAINAADGKLFYKDSGGTVQVLAVKMPSGILPIANGGTNATAAPTSGAVAYGTGTAYAFTSAGTSNQVLISNGSSAPSWSNLSSLGVTSLSFGTTGLTPSTATQGAITVAGTLATTNGGTGLTSFTSGGVVYASSTSALTTGSALTFDGTKLIASGGNEAIRIASGAPYYSFYNAAQSTQFGYIQHTGTDLALVNVQNGAIPFYTNNSEQMRLTSTGLGIGTSSPAQKLDVYGNGMKVNNASYVGYIGADSVFGSSGVASSFTVRSDNALTFSTGGPYTRATIDSSGNLGLGVTPSAWNSAFKVIDFSTTASLAGSSGGANLFNNAYYNGTDYIYKTTAAATRYLQSSGEHYWFRAASGTAGNAITFTQAMTLDASGRLLVGVTGNTGGANLDVISNGTSAFTARSTSSGVSTTVKAVRSVSSDASNFSNAQYDALSHAWILSNSTQAMTLDASGNLAIGLTSASARLHLGGSSNNEIRVDTTASGYLQLGQFSNGAFIGTSSTDATAGVLRLGTGGTERARIDSSGNFLVGTANAAGTSGVGVAINPTADGVRAVSAASTNASETYSMYSTGASAYRFYVNWAGTISATSTTISAISDQRLKENIQDLDVGLDAIMALKPRKFDWKAGKGKDIKGDRGWIAQEFEQVFPDLIDEWKDPAPEGEEPYKSVRADLIPVLVKALQEQQAIITTLTARVAALESN